MWAMFPGLLSNEYRKGFRFPYLIQRYGLLVMGRHNQNEVPLA